MEDAPILAKVLSAAVLGIEAYEVEVEVDLAPGLAAFLTVGLPDAAVKESRDRVAAAIRNPGHQFPLNRSPLTWLPISRWALVTGFEGKKGLEK